MHDFVIETKHLTKIYGEQNVLEKVSLHVEREKLNRRQCRTSAGRRFPPIAAKWLKPLAFPELPNKKAAVSVSIRNFCQPYDTP